MVRQFVFVVAFIFLISIVSAETWFFVQPKPLYNLGDNLEISISVAETGEQLKAELVCGNDTKILFLKYLGNETSVDILQPLSKSFLGEIKGGCKIIDSYGQEVIESSNFVISDAVFLNVGTDNQNYNPGEKVVITGEAEKANTLLLNGFFEIYFQEINFTTSGMVKNGKFEANLTLPGNLAAGNYLFNITVYEKKGEEITNKGERRMSINVKQMPKKLEVALDAQSIKPGNNLGFKILLYDQSGKIIKEEASFLIEDLKEKSIEKDLITVDESRSFFIEKNFSIGYYKIKAYSSGIYGERQFYVEENEEVEFKVVNNTLIIRNIGNTNYDNAVQVKIGNAVEILNTKLAVGDEKKYELIAPSGEYDIIITDGRSNVSSEGVSLTGNAVSVKEAGESFFSRNKILAWFFIILVMGMFVFVSSRRILKRKFVLSESPLKKIVRKIRRKDGELVKGGGIIKVGEKDVIKKEPREAEHSLVLKGQKQDTPIICLKVKNDVSRVARENLQQILEKAYDNKAVTYKTGEYTLLIFSPLITKTFKNHVPAVRTAIEMNRLLKEYNSKFKDKINFGISVHSGNIVNSLQEGKLKFTSLGNTTSIAKKIADISEGEVLLSKDIHEKTITEVKADKKEKYGLEVFTVSRITDVNRNKIFVQDFLRRLAEQGKK